MPSHRASRTDDGVSARRNGICVTNAADRPEAPSLRVGGGPNIGSPVSMPVEHARGFRSGATGWQAGAYASRAARRAGGAFPIAALALRPAAIPFRTGGDVCGFPPETTPGASCVGGLFAGAA